MSKIYVAFLDPGHDEITPGKETPYIAELGRKVKEYEFNQAVVNLLSTELKRHGVQTFQAKYTDGDTPLKDRVNFANNKLAELKKKHGANNVFAVYISVHYNAFDSTFEGANPEGIEIFIAEGDTKNASGALARSILKYLSQGTPQKNRGVKEENFYVLKNTKMPAVLSENGFMDNKREALLMLDTNFQKECAIEHAKGTLEYFGIKYVPIAAAAAPKPKGPDYVGHWAEKSIVKAIDKGIMLGYANGNWEPDKPLTRAEFATVLDRLNLLNEK